MDQANDAEYLDVEYLIEENYDSSCWGDDRDNKKRSAPRTNAQLELLLSYAPEKHLKTRVKTKKWKVLAKRLNKIGPPCHDWKEWRQLYNVTRSKNKRKSKESKNTFKRC